MLDTSADGADRVAGASSESGGAATRAITLIEAALAQAGWQRETLECIAVGLGPGSYTGIRAAIALAQGWQLATGLRLLGLSSVEALVAQAQALGLEGRLYTVIDAQRNEFYLATHDLGPQGTQEVRPLRLATLAEVQQLRDGQIVGPEVTRWFPRGRLLHPEAGALARLAAGRRDFVSGEELTPIYLRETSFVKAPPPRRLPKPRDA